jgi:TM2 domain-containing membrane protein YozV
MAIHIHCPHCHERLEEVHQDCTHCGVELPIGVLYALSAALGKTPLPTPIPIHGRPPSHLTQSQPPAPQPAAMPEQPPAHNSKWRPWFAAALSLLCGLGQFYNGQYTKGLVLLALGVVALVGWQFLPAKMLAPIVWIYAVADAYLVARRTSVPTPSQGINTPDSH